MPPVRVSGNKGSHGLGPCRAEAGEVDKSGTQSTDRDNPTNEGLR